MKKETMRHALLETRQTTHGSFETNADVSQSLKDIFRIASGWHGLTRIEREAMDCIALKFSRILNGRSMEKQHWGRHSRVRQAGRGEMQMKFDLYMYLVQQKTFSVGAFGPGARTLGIIDHIKKELIEIEAAPTDLKEWIDVVTLALDGCWRSGHSPEQIITQLQATLERNMNRTWPDWRTMPLDKAIEHDRSKDGCLGPTGVSCPGAVGVIGPIGDT